MNAKHYVSLEAAKKLKEKKYESNSGFFFHAVERNYKLVYGNPLKPDELVEELYYAPTLLEAMDWLESKGIVITQFVSLDKVWSYSIYKLIPQYELEYERVYTSSLEEGYVGNLFGDNARNECMQKAIEKALELL